MTIITKAALADELSISRPRVSQYVKAGLPVRSDGRLNRADALNWLKSNALGLNSFADRGVNRAGRLAKGAMAKPERRPERKPQPEPTARDLDLRDVLIAMLDRIEAVVAFAVLAAEGSPETAYAAAGIARAEMFEAASDLALTLGAPDEPAGPLGAPPATQYPADWAALADLAGHPVDLDAWREAERRLPYWADADPVDAPHPWKSTSP